MSGHPHPHEQGQLEVMESSMYCELSHVFWYLLETGSITDQLARFFTKGNSPHDFCKFLVLFRREMWSLVEVTLRKELAPGAHTFHGVPSVADEVVF